MCIVMLSWYWQQHSTTVSTSRLTSCTPGSRQSSKSCRGSTPCSDWRLTNAAVDKLMGLPLAPIAVNEMLLLVSTRDTCRHKTLSSKHYIIIECVKQKLNLSLQVFRRKTFPGINEYLPQVYKVQLSYCMLPWQWWKDERVELGLIL